MMGNGRATFSFNSFHFSLVFFFFQCTYFWSAEMGCLCLLTIFSFSDFE